MASALLPCNVTFLKPVRAVAFPTEMTGLPMRCSFRQSTSSARPSQRHQRLRASMQQTSSEEVSHEDPVETSLKIRSILQGAYRADALQVAVKSGIPDVLAKAGGPLSPEEIAKELGPTYVPNQVMRLCRMIATDGLVKETADGKYAANLATRMITKEGGSWGMIMHLHDDRMHQGWRNLDRSLAGEGLGFELANGGPIFEVFKNNPDTSQLWFNQAMYDISQIQLGMILGAYDQGFKALEGKTLVDVGGGLGQLLSAVKRKYPGIKAINFDLPYVVESPARLEGIEHVAGDFFTGPIPAADAIVMKMILHDWDDEACRKILRNCKAALKDGGHLVIIDLVLPPPGPPFEPSGTWAKFLDVHMMTFGGKERTRGEWEGLLKESGFYLSEIVSPPPAPVNIVVAKPSP